ncbi:Cullin [Entamoeba marina]
MCYSSLGIVMNINSSSNCQRIIDIPIINGKYDIDSLRTHFLLGGSVSLESLNELLFSAKEILYDEDNLLRINAPCLIYGDIHGQYIDLLHEQDNEKQIKEKHTTVYLGDYVDRGSMSCEVMITLLCEKVNNPQDIYLLRGNHESKKMTEVFGFKNECSWKYNIKIYESFCDLFNLLPLAALLSSPYFGDFFLCHGGISPYLRLVEEINQIDRIVEPPMSGVMCDLLWADPVTHSLLQREQMLMKCWKDIEYVENDRGCSFFYGYRAVNEFLDINNIRAIVRAHQCVSSGVEQHSFSMEQNATPLAFTVFSAPRYLNNNRSATMFLSDNGICINTFIQSPYKSKYIPILCNSFALSLEKVMESCAQIYDFILNYIEEDDEFDYLAYLKEREEKTPTNPTQTKLWKSESCVKQKPLPPLNFVDSHVIYTSTPTIYENIDLKRRQETIPKTTSDLRDFWNLNQILAGNTLNVLQKATLNQQISDFILENPMEKSNIISIIKEEVIKSFDVQIQSFLANYDMDSFVDFACKMYSSWLKHQQILSCVFMILQDKRRLRTTMSFERVLNDLWTTEFSNTFVKKYDLVSRIIDKMYEIRSNPNSNLSQTILQLLQLLYNSINRSVGTQVITKLINSTELYFTNFMREVRTKKICIPLEFSEPLEKKEISTIVTDNIEKIFSDIRSFWENDDTRGVRIAMSLITLSNPSKDVIESLRTRFDISKIEDILDEYQSVTTNVHLSSFIINSLRSAVSQCKQYQESGDSILVEICRKIHSHIDSGDIQELKRLVRVLEIMPSKDVFESLFWKSLYAKMSNGKIKNLDSEFHFLQLLRKHFDSSMTKRIEQLLKEYVSSQQLLTTFQTKYPHQTIKFQCSIFGITEIGDDLFIPINFPPEMAELFNNFSSLYLSKNPHKVLKLIPEHSKCLVSYKTPNRCFLQCSTLQYLILQCFNTKDICQMEDLTQFVTNAPAALKTCDLLIQHGVMKKEETGYGLQKEYKPKTQITDVTRTQKATTDKKLEDVKIDVERKRFNQLNCSIVKTMKRERTKEIGALINETVLAVSDSFTAQVSTVKKSIEYLLQKEYIKRSDTNPSVLEYLA